MSGKSLAEILGCFDAPPQRIVSLVPSYTDSLFALGMGSAVVGATDYCPLDESAASRIIRLGGPRDVRAEDILALQPDLVLANYEENTRLVVDGLESKGIQVWVSFPRSVKETLEFLWGLVDLSRSQTASLQVRMIESEVDWVRQSVEGQQKLRYFCPIWQGRTTGDQPWWMTFNQDTYPASILELLGGENVFALRTRRYPLEADLGWLSPEETGDRDIRYPCVSLDEIIAGQPEIVFLPDEPYLFTEADVETMKTLLAETPAGRSGNIFQIDGSLINWYGTRLAHALTELPMYFSK